MLALTLSIPLTTSTSLSLFPSHSLQSRQRVWQDRLDHAPPPDHLLANCVLAAAITTYCGPFKTRTRYVGMGVCGYECVWVWVCVWVCVGMGCVYGCVWVWGVGMGVCGYGCVQVWVCGYGCVWVWVCVGMSVCGYGCVWV